MGASILMDHPLRTLLCELFVAPPLRLLQRVFGWKLRGARPLSSPVPRCKSQRRHATPNKTR